MITPVPTTEAGLTTVNGQNVLQTVTEETRREVGSVPTQFRLLEDKIVRDLQKKLETAILTHVQVIVRQNQAILTNLLSWIDCHRLYKTDTSSEV